MVTREVKGNVAMGHIPCTHSRQRHERVVLLHRALSTLTLVSLISYSDLITQITPLLKIVSQLL